MKKLKKKCKTILKKIKAEPYIVFLCVLSAVLLASVVRYGLRSYQFPVWDEQHYMKMATEFFRLLQHPSWNTPQEMLQVLPFRQPGYPLAIVPFLLVFGLSKAYFWGIVTNGVFYVSAIIGIYFLAREFLSKKASFWASIIFASYGWILMHVHTAYSEISVTAMSLLTLLFLLKSDYFRKRNYALLFGLCLGYAILIRWVAIIFVAGPLIYILFLMKQKRIILQKTILVNMGVCIFLAALISLPYFINGSSVLQYFNGHRFGGEMWKIVPEDEKNPFSIYSLTFYLASFEKLGIFYFVLFCLGFLWGFKKSSKYKIILTAIIFPWIFFSFFSILKSDRFIVPIYPYIAIVSAAVFDKVTNRKGKTVLLVSTCIIAVLSFLGSAWGKGPMKQDLFYLPVKLPFGQFERIHLTSVSRPPYIYKLSGKEILEYIAEDSYKNNIVNPKINQLFSYRPLDEPMYTYNQYHLEKPLQIVTLVGSVVNDPDKNALSIVSATFEDTDYLLVKTGKKMEYYFPKNNYQSLEGALIVLDKYLKVSDYYEKKATFWIYQDSSEVIVYKKKKKLGKEKIQEISEKLADDLHKMKDKKVGTFAK